MEFDWIPRWWSVITTLVSLLAAIALLWLSKTFARREDLKKLESDMADKIRIGINGFGRIGRMVFRAARTREMTPPALFRDGTPRFP